MYYCYNKEQELFNFEQELVKTKGLYICFDKNANCFFDANGNAIDITGLSILVRTGAFDAEELISKVNQFGGISLTSVEDIDKVLSWPNYVKTKRNLCLTTGKEILDNPHFFHQFNVASGVFFKTKKKNYSHSLDIFDIFDERSPFITALRIHENDEFIVSDLVKIVQNETGQFEYRAFVMDGKIMNISRIHDSLYHQISEEVIKVFQEKVNELINNGFPRNFTIDIFKYIRNGEINYDLLECNPIESSYPYIYNSVIEACDLKHEDPESCLPLERKLFADTSSYSYSAQYKSDYTVLLKMKGGFAHDYFWHRFRPDQPFMSSGSKRKS